MSYRRIRVVATLTLGFVAVLAGSSRPLAAQLIPLLPGRIELAIPATGNSQNLVSAPVTAQLCPNEFPTVRDPRIVLATDGGGSTPRWDSLSRALVVSLDAGAATAPVTLPVHALDLAWTDSQPIVLGCGTFTQKVVLTAGPQPSGTLNLGRSNGTLSLPIAITRRFTRQNDGMVIEIPATLEINVSGAYAVAPPNGTSDSNVLFLAALVNGAWAPVESCGLELLLGGIPCFSANLSWLDRAALPTR